MADSKLNILINAKNNASGALNEVKSELGGLEQAAGIASKAAIAVGIAMAAMKGAQVAWELGEASAGTMRLATAFQSLATQAGQSGDAILSAMKAASRGTIDDTSLMAAANRAMLLGVADSAEEFTKLLEVASARGKAMGLSTAQAFSDLVTGIGRMSPMILDNLGILTGGEKAFDNYAASIGKTADQLSDAEKKQYLLNAAFASTKELIDANAQSGGDLADNFERMDASIANAKDSLGQLFAPAVAAIAQQIADATDAAVGAVERLGGAFENPVNQLEILQTELNQVNLLLGEYQAAGMQDGPEFAAAAAEAARLGTAINVAKASGDAFNFTAAEMESRSAAAARSGADLADAHTQAAFATDHFAASMQGLAGITAGTAAAISQARSIALGWVDTLGAAGALGKFEDINAQIKDLRQTMFDAGATTDEMDFATASLVDSWRGANTAITAYGQTATAINSTMDTLTGKVSSLLSSSLDPGVGVDPSQFLPREDAINEDARRLADVAVKGYESPWFDYLNNKFPGMFDKALSGSGGDIQGAAAAMLRDFQNGLRPELLDKEAAKERIKQMLLGDANMAALAQEISAELQSELGGQFSAADIAKATGAVTGTDKTGASAGGQFSTGFTTAITDGNAAQQAVNGLLDGIVGKFEDIVKNGGAAGGKWFEGFKAAVADAMENYIPPPPGTTSTDPTGVAGGTARSAARAVGVM